MTRKALKQQSTRRKIQKDQEATLKALSDSGNKKGSAQFFFDENEYRKKLKSPRKVGSYSGTLSSTETASHSTFTQQEKLKYAEALKEVIEENSIVHFSYFVPHPNASALCVLGFH